MLVARLFFAGLVSSALAVQGCSSGPPPDPYPSCSNGHYVLDDPGLTPNGFDSGACRAFMKAIPSIQSDSTKAPEFITPLAGALLPATPIAQFKWTPGTLASLDLKPREIKQPSFWHELRRAFEIEGTAYAAADGGGTLDGGSTLTSDAYVVIFNASTPSSDGGITELLRVMTINTDFTPDDTQWATLQAAGSIEATVYGMHFDNGSITSGPYVASQPIRQFSIAAQ
jgi:hypothetical protein